MGQNLVINMIYFLDFLLFCHFFFQNGRFFHISILGPQLLKSTFTNWLVTTGFIFLNLQVSWFQSKYLIRPM